MTQVVTEPPDVLSELEKIEIETAAKRTNEVTNFSWDCEEHTGLSVIAMQLIRMGFKLVNHVHEGLHEYTSDIWSCTLNPVTHIIQLEYMQRSGTNFSALVMSAKETSTDKIVASIAETYFMHGDVEVDKMIKHDKKLWNEQHSDKLGIW